MKVKAYMRVGKKLHGGKAMVAANVKPTLQPLSDSAGPVATVAFAVVFDIPDSVLDRASEVIAEIKVDGRKVKVAAEVETV